MLQSGFCYAVSLGDLCVSWSRSWVSPSLLVCYGVLVGLVESVRNVSLLQDGLLC